jgi:hypothetical protein
MSEAISPSWSVTIEKRDLVDAIGTARRRPTLRRVSSGRGGFEDDVVLASCTNGLSVRSSNSAMDISATGMWASPIAVSGATIRQLAPKLAGPQIELTYCDGQLALNQTRLSAREV